MKNYIITESQSIALRRRIDEINKLLDMVLDSSEPCTYSNELSFYDKVIYDFESTLFLFQPKGISADEVYNFVKDYKKDDIIRYYLNSQEDC